MPADPAIVAALGATDLFRSLDRKTLGQVADLTSVVRHASGSEVASEGKNGVAFHLILEGAATVTIGGQLRGKLGEGDYFGEISLIDGSPRTATVTVEEDLVTASLASWDFRPLLEREPTMANALLLVMCKRLRQSEADART